MPLPLWHFAMESDEVAEVQESPGEPPEVCHSGSQQLVAADSGARSSVESDGGQGLTNVTFLVFLVMCFCFLFVCFWVLHPYMHR